MVKKKQKSSSKKDKKQKPSKKKVTKPKMKKQRKVGKPKIKYDHSVRPEEDEILKRLKFLEKLHKDKDKPTDEPSVRRPGRPPLPESEKVPKPEKLPVGRPAGTARTSGVRVTGNRNKGSVDTQARNQAADLYRQKLFVPQDPNKTPSQDSLSTELLKYMRLFTEKESKKKKKITTEEAQKNIDEFYNATLQMMGQSLKAGEKWTPESRARQKTAFIKFVAAQKARVRGAAPISHVGDFSHDVDSLFDEFEADPSRKALGPPLRGEPPIRTSERMPASPDIFTKAETAEERKARLRKEKERYRSQDSGFFEGSLSSMGDEPSPSSSDRTRSSNVGDSAPPKEVTEMAMKTIVKMEAENIKENPDISDGSVAVVEGKTREFNDLYSAIYVSTSKKIKEQSEERSETVDKTNELIGLSNELETTKRRLLIEQSPLVSAFVAKRASPTSSSSLFSPPAPPLPPPPAPSAQPSPPPSVIVEEDDPDLDDVSADTSETIERGHEPDKTEKSLEELSQWRDSAIGILQQLDPLDADDMAKREELAGFIGQLEKEIEKAMAKEQRLGIPPEQKHTEIASEIKELSAKKEAVDSEIEEGENKLASIDSDIDTYAKVETSLAAYQAFFEQYASNPKYKKAIEEGAEAFASWAMSIKTGFVSGEAKRRGYLKEHERIGKAKAKRGPASQAQIQATKKARAAKSAKSVSFV